MKEVKSNKTNFLYIYWYSILLKLTKTISELFSWITNKFNNKHINKFVTKQQSYINRESIYYTQNLILSILMCILCTVFKPTLIVFITLKCIKLFYVPIITFHRLTTSYKFKAILTILMLILGTLLNGFIGSALSILAFGLNFSCNLREFENKYIYCTSNKRVS